jgi:hypothetical protein
MAIGQVAGHADVRSPLAGILHTPRETEGVAVDYCYAIRKMEDMGEREALLIGVPEKEDNHGDHTTA